VSSFPELGGRLLVVYDGTCGLCNRAVRWLVWHDRLDRLRFTSSESENGSILLIRHRIVAPESRLIPTTILVVRNAGTPAEHILIRSQAVLAILDELPPPWPAIAGTLGLFPPSVLDVGYRLVARWRYRIWGRAESCPLPTPKDKARFV
jgi:predicted DCC family thiol-disulfide oxidoreductase YuxK